MIEGDIARIRTAEVFADVQTTGRIVAIKEYEGGPAFGRRWAALMADASAEVPAFGFEKPPPVGAWVAVRGTVGGFTAEALRDREFVAQVIAKRGWADEVEIGVDGWRVIEPL